ncbi:inositol monophosphatase family protein [Microbacterium sp. NPDC091662]|uniref:inositol monophosphatase family protein n=1 Tax=Microbacterium sp. NPDC091662 TaxID=3364211 RepID=UPI00380015AD
MPSASDLLDIAISAASAGAAVLAEAARDRDASPDGLGLRTKGASGDVVTEIDLRAERAIRAVIAEHRPDDEVSGEEYATTGSGSALRWSIDPLDGTSNFVRGLPHYGSSVAVQDARSGSWLAGVVHAPELDHVYSAGSGLGAYRESGGIRRRLRGPATDATPVLLAVGFSYDPEQRARQLAELPTRMSAFTDLRSIGSAALGLCLVAEGSVDAFIETDLYEFDWAAGALIAEEAGLIVRRPATVRGGIVAHPPHLPVA